MENPYCPSLFVRVGLLDTEDEKANLEELFRVITAKKKWGVPPDLGKFYPQSVQWGVYIHRELIGGAMITSGGKHGLPYEHVWPDFTNVAERESKCGEITYFVINRQPESTLQYLITLIASMAAYCEHVGIEYLFTCITERRARQYRALGFPWRVLGPTQTHWDYPSNLLVLSLAESRRFFWGQHDLTQVQKTLRGHWEKISRIGGGANE